MSFIKIFVFRLLVCGVFVVLFFSLSRCELNPQPARLIAHAQVMQPQIDERPLSVRDCPIEGCGYIDFNAHPELIGGGLVLEPESN